MGDKEPFFSGQSLSVFEDGIENVLQRMTDFLPQHLVLLLSKNKNSDTAESYHITIVSFNKHFFKTLYIYNAK